MRMFCPVEQHNKAAFIQEAQIGQHAAAFDPRAPRLSWGHLLFDDCPAVLLKRARHILLARDP